MKRVLSEAILDSEIFVCCLTDLYCKKIQSEGNYCSYEFEWAAESLGSANMILLVLEPVLINPKNRGILMRAEFPHRLHLDFTRWNNGDTEKERCLNLLIEEIRRIRNHKKHKHAEKEIKSKQRRTEVRHKSSAHDTLGGLTSEETRTLFKSPLLFDSKVKRKAAELLEGTRLWLFKDGMKWFQEASNNPKQNVYLLQAPPGAGKSVFTSAVATRKSSSLIGIFCFDYLEMKSLVEDPIYTFIYSIAYQLAKNVPKLTNVVIEAAMNLQHERDVVTLFNELILNPLRNLQRKTKTKQPKSYLLVIDGVDECRNRTEFMQYLLDLIIPELCKMVKIFISCRSGVSFVSNLREGGYGRGCDFNLTTVEAHLDEDLKLYLQAQFPHQPDVVSKLLAKSVRNFLYLILVCKELRSKQSQDTEQDILTFIDQELPTGLNNYYPYYIRRLEKQEGWQKYLKAIVCSLEPLALCEIRVLSGLDDVQQHFLTFQELFPAAEDSRSDADEWEDDAEAENGENSAKEDDAEESNEEWGASVRPFHLSIVDWLKDAKSFPFCYIDPVEGNRFILGSLMRQISSDLNYSSVQNVEKKFKLEANRLLRESFGIAESYICTHLLTHLVMDKQWKICYYIVMSLSWIQRKLLWSELDELQSDIIEALGSVPKGNSSKIATHDLGLLNSFLRLFDKKDDEERDWSAEISNQLFGRTRSLLEDDLFLPPLPHSEPEVSVMSEVVGHCQFKVNDEMCLLSGKPESLKSFVLEQESRFRELNQNLKDWYSEMENKIFFLAPTLPQLRDSSLNGLQNYPFLMGMKGMCFLPSGSVLVYGWKDLIIITVETLKTIYEYQFDSIAPYGSNLLPLIRMVVTSESFIYIKCESSANKVVLFVFDFTLKLLTSKELDLGRDSGMICLVNDELLLYSFTMGLPRDVNRLSLLRFSNGILISLAIEPFSCSVLKYFRKFHDNRSMTIQELHSLDATVSECHSELDRFSPRRISRKGNDYLVVFSSRETLDSVGKWIKCDESGDCKVIATFVVGDLKLQDAVLIPERMEIVCWKFGGFEILSFDSPSQDSAPTERNIRVNRRTRVTSDGVVGDSTYAYHNVMGVLLFLNGSTLHVIDYQHSDTIQKMAFKSSTSPLFELSRTSDHYLLRGQGWNNCISIPSSEMIETPVLPIHPEFLALWRKSRGLFSFFPAASSDKNNEYYTIVAGEKYDYVFRKMKNKEVPELFEMPGGYYLFPVTTSEIVKIRGSGTENLIFFDVFNEMETGSVSFPDCGQQKQQMMYCSSVLVNPTCLLFVFEESSGFLPHLLVITRKDLVDRDSPAQPVRLVMAPPTRYSIDARFIRLNTNLLLFPHDEVVSILQYDDTTLCLTEIEACCSIIEFLDHYLPIIALDLPIRVGSWLDELFYCSDGFKEFMKVSEVVENDFYGVSRKYFELIVTEKSGHTHWIAYFLDTEI
jgi:hypothetical protein